MLKAAWILAVLVLLGTGAMGIVNTAGVIGAFVVTALIGALIVWTARRSTRAPASPESREIR